MATAGIAWSDDLVVIDAEMPLHDALERVRGAGTPWVVVRRAGGRMLYALRSDELLGSRRLAALPRGASRQTSVAQAFDLHETQQSTPARDRAHPPPIDRS